MTWYAWASRDSLILLRIGMHGRQTRLAFPHFAAVAAITICLYPRCRLPEETAISICFRHGGYATPNYRGGPGDAGCASGGPGHW